MKTQPLALLVTGGLLALLLGLFALTGWAAPGNPVLDPPRHSHTAPLTTTVSITYDEPISPTTVTSRTFALHAMQSGLVTASYGVRGGTIVVTPTRPFHAGEPVYAIATTGTLGLGGAAPAGPTQWQFQPGQVRSRCFAGMTDTGVELPGIHGSSVAWGDYDGDGDLDLLLTGHAGGEPLSVVYRNDGPAADDPGAGWTWTAVDAGLVGVWLGSASWGDYDNDGDLDILLTGDAGGHSGAIHVARVYRNDGPAAGSRGTDSSWTFTDIDAGLQGVYYSSAAWGDYDNDGDLDIALSGDTSYIPSVPTTRIYRNDGPSGGSGWAFTDIGAGLANSATGTVAWGDHDNDGDLDLLVVGFGPPYLYRNDGPSPGLSWAFTEIEIDPYPRADCSAAWGDYDNDGDLDVLIDWALLQNKGAAGGWDFDYVDAGLPHVSSGSVAWGDYDNDGDLDILITGETSTYLARIYRNEGAGTNWSFADIGAGLTGVVGSDAAWGDYDGDGDLDIVLTGFSNDHELVAQIYRNDDCPAPALALAKAAHTEVATPHEALTYTLWVSNTGNVPLQATITDVLPAHVTPTGLLTWLPAPIWPGDTWTRTVIVTVEPGYVGPLSNVLRVRTSEGPSGTYTNTVIVLDVHITGLSAANDGPTALGAPTTLTATVAAGSNAGYAWDLGDGETGSGPSLSHVYPAVGTYTAVVTANNSVSSLTASTVITVDEAISGLSADNDGPTALGTATLLTATVAGGSNVSCAWAFGDGDSGHGPLVSHTYPQAGTYTAVVTASNSLGHLSVTTMVAVEEAVAGLAALNDGPTELGTPTTLTATVTAGSHLTYTWSFGERGLGHGAVVSHTYPAAGVFTAIVTADNSVGQLTATTRVTVTEPYFFSYLPVILKNH